MVVTFATFARSEFNKCMKEIHKKNLLADFKRLKIKLIRFFEQTNKNRREKHKKEKWMNSYNFFFLFSTVALIAYQTSNALEFPLSFYVQSSIHDSNEKSDRKKI